MKTTAKALWVALFWILLLCYTGLSIQRNKLQERVNELEQESSFYFDIIKECQGLQDI